jgi:WD40 repeat protein/serine/threonine protein kinase
MPPDRPDPAPLDFVEFLDQIDADRRLGQVLPLSHYLARFPCIETEVAAEYLHRHTDAAGASARAPDVRADDSGKQIAHYRLVRELGRGGQGSVHLARDTRMGRLVALKLLPGDRTATAHSALRRFRHEAEAIARLDHPSLCSVLEARFDGDTPFLAMRYVDGETLKERLRRSRGESTPDAPPAKHELPALLTLIERVARAIHAAHEAGVVHRDLKPGNIQIDREGLPVVLDFGLARIERDDITMTLPGQVLGTLAYMAPEQLAGQRAPVDRRADVYSLGVVLFECVSGRHPFDGVDSTTLSDADRRPPAPDPRAFNPAVTPELAVVVETALAMAPGQRYPTALAFAEDLRRLREFEPIRARPASAWLRARRFLRRRRRTLAAAAIVLTATTISGFLWVHDAIAERARILVQIASQARALARTDPGMALSACLVAADADPDDESTMTTAMTALGNLHEVWATNVGDEPEVVTSVALTDGAVATGAVDGGFAVWDLRTGEPLAAMRRSGPVQHVTRVQGEGEFVATWRDGAMYSWRRDHGFRPLRPPDLGGSRVLAARAVPGRSDELLLVTQAHELVLWDRTRDALKLRARHTNSPAVPTDQLTLVAFAADGARFATAMGQPVARDGRLHPVDGRVMVWSTATGACLVDFGPHAGRANWIEFSPDGSLLASSFLDGTLRVHELPDGRLRYERRYEGDVKAARFDPSGRYLAVGIMLADPFDLDEASRAIRVLAAGSGDELHRLPGHDHRSVSTLAWSPDGAWLASACTDRTICLRRGFPVEPDRVLMRGQAYPEVLEWSADGQAIVSLDVTARCWSTSQTAIRELGPHPGLVTAARFSPDGRWVATGCTDGAVRIWDPDRGRELHLLDLHTGPVRRVEVTGDGRWLVATGDRPTIGLIDVRAGWRTLAVAGHTAPITVLALRRDGRFAATGAQNGTVALVDLQVDPPVLRILGAHREQVDCAAFSGDGRRLSTGGGDRRVLLWDVPGGTLAASRTVFEPADDPSFRKHVLAIGPSPDGASWLATTDAPRVLTLGACLESDHGTALDTTIGQLDADPAGGRVVVGGRYRGVCILLRWPGLDLLEYLPMHDNLVSRIAFSTSGRFLLTCSFDGTARLVRMDGPPRPWARLIGHTDAVLDGDLSRDERSVVTASADGTARIWPTDPIAYARSARFARYSVRQTGWQLLGR